MEFFLWVTVQNATRVITPNRNLFVKSKSNKLGVTKPWVLVWQWIFSSSHNATRVITPNRHLFVKSKPSNKLGVTEPWAIIVWHNGNNTNLQLNCVTVTEGINPDVSHCYTTERYSTETHGQSVVNLSYDNDTKFSLV